MELVLASLLNVIYFTLASYVVYLKVRDLYIILMQNQKLTRQIKNILQIFPNGVIIHSHKNNDDKKIHFSNKEFQQRIGDIKSDIENLKNVKVSYSIAVQDELRRVNNNLFSFLKSQEMKLRLNQTTTSKNVTFKPFQFTNQGTNETEEVSSKVFSIKSIKVDWEGNQDSFMHVFIDTTDIIALEKANDNIKLQKIMFASASHEFRTPLNAILNSFRILETSNEDILKNF